MEFNPFSLKNKKILITGAFSGIGKATTIACSKMGATVFIKGRDKYRLKGSAACSLYFTNYKQNNRQNDKEIIHKGNFVLFT